MDTPLDTIEWIEREVFDQPKSIERSLEGFNIGDKSLESLQRLIL